MYKQEGKLSCDGEKYFSCLSLNRPAGLKGVIDRNKFVGLTKKKERKKNRTRKCVRFPVDDQISKFRLFEHT